MNSINPSLFCFQYWRDKAEETRKLLGLTSPRDASTPTLAASHGKAQTKVDKTEPIDLAAHLQLLGESLSTIGACLRVQVRRSTRH